MDMKIVSLLAGLMLLATLSLAPAAMAQGTNFLAVLNGANQIPSVSTNGHGVFLASLSVDGKSLAFRLIVANIENVVVAHIHLGDSTHNGPPVAFLLHPTLLPGRSDGTIAMGTITGADLVGPLQGQPLSALVDAIQHGNTYVNVHTTQNPSGEIRGQIFLADESD
jgi:hypothetical protein